MVWLCSAARQAPPLRDSFCDLPPSFQPRDFGALPRSSQYRAERLEKRRGRSKDARGAGTDIGPSLAGAATQGGVVLETCGGFLIWAAFKSQGSARCLSERNPLEGLPQTVGGSRVGALGAVAWEVCTARPQGKRISYHCLEACAPCPNRNLIRRCWLSLSLFITALASAVAWDVCWQGLRSHAESQKILSYSCGEVRGMRKTVDLSEVKIPLESFSEISRVDRETRPQESRTGGEGAHEGGVLLQQS